MTVIALSRRLEKIEGRPRSGPITAVCNLGADPDEVVAGALRDWRGWTADGRAKCRCDVLVLLPPIRTAAEWPAGNPPHTGRLQ